MNKLSTQVVAFLVLIAVTLVGVLIVTNSDIDTTVKTADASVLALNANDSSVDFSISYPSEWQVAPSSDGSGYVFTLKDPLKGVADEAQPQIQIALQNLPYADTLASAQSDLGTDSLVAYDTIDNRRNGVRYTNTNTLDNGQQVVAEITILNPVDQSVAPAVEENRTVIARVSADSNHIGDYRQTLDLMLTTIKLGEPFRVPELVQTFTNPNTGITVSYPEGWTASVDPQSSAYTDIVPPNAAYGVLRVVYAPLLDTTTGQLMTLADLESANIDPSTIIQPMAFYSAGGYSGEAGVISITNSSTNEQRNLYVVFLQLSDTDAAIAVSLADGEVEQIMDAILQTIQFASPATPEATEVPTEEATPAAEETATPEATEIPTEEATEVATEAPTEAPTVEATPAN